MTISISDVMNGNDVSSALSTMSKEEQQNFCHGVCEELMTQLAAGNKTGVGYVACFLQKVEPSIVFCSIKEKIKTDGIIKNNLDLDSNFSIVLGLAENSQKTASSSQNQ